MLIKPFPSFKFDCLIDDRFFLFHQVYAQPAYVAQPAVTVAKTILPAQPLAAYAQPLLHAQPLLAKTAYVH